MSAEASALIDQLQRLRDGAAAISITQRSANAEVTVTVNRDGAVTAIEFGGTATGMPPARLSAITMDTIRRATGKIGEHYARAVGESGLDDDSADHIIANYRTRHPARFAEENPAVGRPVTHDNDDDDQETSSFMHTGYGTRRG